MLSKAKALEKLVLPTPFLVGPVNIYLIKGDVLTLVDTGPNTPAAKNALEQSLKNIGYRTNDIEQVILTHHHPDHVGLVAELFSDATIVGHAKNNPWLTKDKQFITYVEAYIRSFYKGHGTSPEIIEKIVGINEYYLSFSGEKGIDVEVEEGDQIEGLPGWTVIETPGHAQSHICLYNEREATLIGGDHIISHISSNAILEPPFPANETRPRTLLQYRNSLQKCVDLEVKKVYSGHGGTVENIKPLIESRFKEQVDKASRLKQLIHDKGTTSFEMCKEYFSRVYMKEPSLTMSEIIGHLDLLEARGEIYTVENEGIIFYHKK